MLAMQATSKLWDSTYFSIDYLLQNVACIQFRPKPLTRSRINLNHAEMEQSIHVFILKHDNLRVR